MKCPEEIKSIPKVYQVLITLAPPLHPGECLPQNFLSASSTLRPARLEYWGILALVCVPCVSDLERIFPEIVYISFQCPRPASMAELSRWGQAQTGTHMDAGFCISLFGELFSSTHTHRQVLQDATSSSGSQAYEVVLVSRSFLLALRVYFLHG